MMGPYSVEENLTEHDPDPKITSFFNFFSFMLCGSIRSFFSHVVVTCVIQHCDPDSYASRSMNSW